MNNFIQFLIAAVLGSLGIAEEAEVASQIVEPETRVEVATTSIDLFSPVEEQEWKDCGNVFYLGFVLDC